MQRLVPVKLMALARTERVQKEVEIGGAGQGAIFKGRGAGPPNNVAFAEVVFDYSGLACAAILRALVGVADLPSGLWNHPHFAGISERIESFRFELACGKIEFFGGVGLAIGKNVAAPVPGGNDAPAAFHDLADGLDVVGLAREGFSKDNDSGRSSVGCELCQWPLPTFDGITCIQQRFKGRASAVLPGKVTGRQ